MKAVHQVFVQAHRQAELAVRCSDDTAVPRQRDACLAARRGGPVLVPRSCSDASDIFVPRMALPMVSCRAALHRAPRQWETTWLAPLIRLPALIGAEARPASVQLMWVLKLVAQLSVEARQV